MAVQASIRYSTGVENAWSSFMEAVPKIIAFAVILAIGFLIAKVVAKAVTRVLRKVNFDRFVQRGAVQHAMAKSQYDASQIAGKLAYYALGLLTLVMAFGVFGGTNPVSRLLAGIVAFIPKLVVAIVIVLVAAAVAGWIKDIVANALGGLPYGSMLGAIASAAILVTGVFMALSQLLIAPAIVTGLFYAVLAALVGVTVVAVGGGGIAPMRARWERALDVVDSEAPKVKEHARNAKAERAAYAAQSAQYTQPYAGQPYPGDQQFGANQVPGFAGAAGAPLPPAAYSGAPLRPAQGQGFPAEPTIDLTQEELQRLGAAGKFASPSGEQGQPPAGSRP